MRKKHGDKPQERSDKVLFADISDANFPRKSTHFIKLCFAPRLKGIRSSTNIILMLDVIFITQRVRSELGCCWRMYNHILRANMCVRILYTMQWQCQNYFWRQQLITYKRQCYLDALFIIQRPFKVSYNSIYYAQQFHARYTNRRASHHNIQRNSFTLLYILLG